MSKKAIKLTLKERYFLSMYARMLPSSIALRMEIEPFLNDVQLTVDEITKYAVSGYNEKEFTCTDYGYKKEITVIPDAVVKSMKHFVDSVKEGEDDINDRIVKYFKLIV